MASLMKYTRVADKLLLLTLFCACARFRFEMVSVEASCYCCTSHAHYAYCVVTDRLLSDRNTEEQTAIAAYWVTDGVDRCRVGFLPRHYVRQAMQFDGQLVQVVAMLADAENPRQRQFSRFNRGACHATVIDADFSRQEQQSSTATANGGNGSAITRWNIMTFEK